MALLLERIRGSAYEEELNLVKIQHNASGMNDEIHFWKLLVPINQREIACTHTKLPKNDAGRMQRELVLFVLLIVTATCLFY